MIVVRAPRSTTAMNLIVRVLEAATDIPVSRDARNNYYSEPEAPTSSAETSRPIV